jgi:hypothetical protein
VHVDVESRSDTKLGIRAPQSRSHTFVEQVLELVALHKRSIRKRRDPLTSRARRAALKSVSGLALLRRYSKTCSGANRRVSFRSAEIGLAWKKRAPLSDRRCRNKPG